MSVNLYAAVTAWLTKAVPSELATGGFAQIDLVELLGSPPPQAAETGMLCLELAVILSRQERPDADGYLTIPLPASESLTHESPMIQDTLAQTWEYVPGAPVPGLHLIEPRHRPYEDVEEYRRHLMSEGSLPPGYAAYYRTWRTQEQAAAGAQYNRTITVRTIDHS